MARHFRNNRTRALAGTRLSDVDYKNLALLKQCIVENGKISPARMTGSSSHVQRELALAVKRARYLALLPYSDAHR